MSGLRDQHLSFANFHREEEDRGEIVGCDMSAVVMPAPSKSKGFWGKESLGDRRP